jgi:phosphohistidine swiveling domain-containing protein
VEILTNKEYTQLEVRFNDLLTNFLKTHAWSESNLLIQQMLGTGFTHSLRVSEKGKVTNYMLKDELLNIDKVLLAKLDGILQNIEGIENKFKAISQFFVSLKDIDYENVSNKELLSLYNKYCSCFSQMASILYIIFRSDDVLEKPIKRLNDFIASKLNNNEKVVDWVGILSLPLFESYVMKEEMDFLEILVKIQDFSNLSNEELNVVGNHSKNYCWVPIQQDERPWDLDYYLKLIKLQDIGDAKNRLSELRNYLPNLIKKQKEILSIIKPDERIRSIISNLQNIGYLRDIRKICYSKARLYSRKMFGEIGKRLGINSKDIGYLLPKEVKLLLSKAKIVDNRKKNYVIQLQNNDVRVLTGDKAKEIQDSIVVKSSDDVDFLKGRPASPGNVKGRVKLIFNINEADDFNEGDILVTTMTVPDLVPLMKKAAAIVTDEGGLTCHAAIVSREMGIPCIVGTEKATKVLKDGDMVEVKASEGMIIKIK